MAKDVMMRKSTESGIRGDHCAAVSRVLVTALSAFLLPVCAHASLLDYALISLTGSLTVGNNLTVTTAPGNIGALGNVVLGNGGSITGGVIARDDAPASSINLGSSIAAGPCVTAGGSITGSCGSTDTTGTHPLIGSFDAAVSEAALLIAGLDALPVTDPLAAVTGSTTISSSNTGLVVFSIPSITLGSNQLLTLSGAPTDTFVINTASIFFDNNSDIALAGGLLASHIVFNLGTSGISVSGSELFGTFLVGGGGCTISNSFSLDGALICNGAINLGNDISISANPFFSEIPEPATGLLAGLGLVSLLIVCRRKVRHAAS